MSGYERLLGGLKLKKAPPKTVRKDLGDYHTVGGIEYCTFCGRKRGTCLCSSHEPSFCHTCGRKLTTIGRCIECGYDRPEVHVYDYNAFTTQKLIFADIMVEDGTTQGQNYRFKIGHTSLKSTLETNSIILNAGITFESDVPNCFMTDMLRCAIIIGNDKTPNILRLTGEHVHSIKTYPNHVDIVLMFTLTNLQMRNTPNKNTTPYVTNKTTSKLTIPISYTDSNGNKISNFTIPPKETVIVKSALFDALNNSKHFHFLKVEGKLDIGQL